MTDDTSIANEAPAAGKEQEPADTQTTNQAGKVEEQGAAENAAPELNEDGTPKEPEKKAGEKPEKTEAERERIRMQRGIDRRTRQLAEERAARMELERRVAELTASKEGVNYQLQGGDSEPLSLTRAQLEEMVKSEAAKLAPTLTQQHVEEARRKSVVESLTKQFGQERFDELASDLEDALGGLTDSSQRPKPIVDAVFEAKNPASVIEWLADPDHHEEAASISQLAGIRLGRAMAELEIKIAAQKAAAKPKQSQASRPLEVIRGQGATNSAPDPVKDEKAWRKWRNEQERMRA